MSVRTVQDADVQVAGGGVREPLPKLANEFQIERPDALDRIRRVVNEVGPPGKIDRRPRERFVHREEEEAVSADAFLVAERGFEGGAERDPDVFDGVMPVDFEVAVDAQLEIDERVRREKGQHMIEKADSGRNFRRAGSVEVDFQPNLRFLGVALDRRRSRHFTFSYFISDSILFFRRRFNFATLCRNAPRRFLFIGVFRSEIERAGLSPSKSLAPVEPPVEPFRSR